MKHSSAAADCSFSHRHRKSQAEKGRGKGKIFGSILGSIGRAEEPFGDGSYYGFGAMTKIKAAGKAVSIFAPAYFCPRPYYISKKGAIFMVIHRIWQI